MRKIVLIFALGLFLMGCVSQDKLELHGVEKVNLRGSSTSAAAVDITISASNASGSNVTLKHADFTIYNGTGSIAEISVPNTVQLPKRSVEQEVVIPIKVQFTGRLGMLSLLSLSRNLDNVYISGKVVVKAGIGKKTINIARMPLKDFAKQFNIDISGLTDFKL